MGYLGIYSYYSRKNLEVQAAVCFRGYCKTRHLLGQTPAINQAVFSMMLPQIDFKEGGA